MADDRSSLRTPGPTRVLAAVRQAERRSLGASRQRQHDLPVGSIHLRACGHPGESRGELRTAEAQLEWRVN